MIQTPKPQTLEQKRQAALQYLGTKWLLARNSTFQPRKPRVLG